MTRSRLALVTIGLFVSAFGHGCIFGGCSKDGPPPPDACDEATTGDVDMIEIGRGTTDDELPFEPWSDGDVIDAIYGGQGSAMVALRIRLTGASPPHCLAQVTVVIDATTLGPTTGRELASSSDSVSTYVDGVARTTHTIWIPTFEFPTPPNPLRIHTVAGGKEITRLLYSGVAPVPVIDLSVPRDFGAADASQPLDLATTD